MEDNITVKEQVKILNECAKLSEDTEIRRLPWKPEEGDSFWIVNSDDYVRCRTWRGIMADLVYFCSGNCFRTAEDADASRERIKGGLMNYYKNYGAARDV